jgi:hypothetical protein
MDNINIMFNEIENVYLQNLLPVSNNDNLSSLNNVSNEDIFEKNLEYEIPSISDTLNIKQNIQKYETKYNSIINTQIKLDNKPIKNTIDMNDNEISNELNNLLGNHYKMSRGRGRVKQLNKLSSKQKKIEQLYKKEKNRLSAKICRAKKKQYYSNLEKMLEHFKIQNSNLKQLFEKQNVHLKKLFNIKN